MKSVVGLYENRQAVGGATDPQLHSNRTVIHFKREYLVQLYYTRGHRPGAPQNTWSTADLAGARAWRPYGCYRVSGGDGVLAGRRACAPSYNKVVPDIPF